MSWAMKSFLLLVLFSISMSVLAGEKVNKRLNVEANAIVEIHNVRGELNITGWSKSQVQVVGVLDDLANEFVFSSQENKTVIKVKLPENTSYHNREGSRLDIQVPEKSQLQFFGVATDIKVAGVNGGTSVKSVSGSIHIHESDGDVDIRSVSGAIVLRDIAARIEVSTVSGDLDAQVDAAKIVVSGVSSNFSLVLGAIESGSFANVSGSTRVSGRLPPKGEVQIESVSGYVEFAIEENLNAEVTMNTAAGGKVTNKYSKLKPISTYAHSQSLQFKAGKAEGKLRMSTVNGHLVLTKKTE